ncbi:MAG TPA: hypothetical protein DD706_09915 [Nitrospiraceae bacterium]|nr:hypothetical protein [Nitrospiraceae bacterium]
MNTIPPLIRISRLVMRLRPGFAHFFLGFLMIVSISHLGSVHAKPYIPDSDSLVLEHIPLSGTPQMRQLRAARLELSRDPQNLALAVRLARQLVELGRAEADPRYDSYAQAALRFWWNSSKPPTEVLFIRALLRQRSHHFDEALKDLTQVLQNQPHHAQAWLTRSVIYQVRGDYQNARQNCRPLLRLTDSLVTTTCIANVTSLNGQAEESYKGLLNQLSSTSSPDPQKALWASILLAETAARLGNSSSAEAHFQQALSLGLRDTYLLGAYSDWLLDQNRPADVQALLRDDLHPDGLLLRMALAAQQLTNDQLLPFIVDLTARFTNSRLRGDTRHLREEARFTLHLLKQPKRALQLAQENWKMQREPWDARILLEAALQSGNPTAAQPVLDWLETVKLEDQQIRTLVEQFS